MPGQRKTKRKERVPQGRLIARLSHRATHLLLCLMLAASVAIAQKAPPAKPIDLNTATAAELQQLPGIGPATAKAIIQFREKSGPFQRPEDLLAIHGISRARFEKIRPYITVRPPKIT